MISRCADVVTMLCIQKMVIENEDREIYKYGFEMIISVCVNLFWVLIAGIAFHRVLFSLVAFICFATVRTQSGGYHAKSYLMCNLQLFLVFIIIMIITKYFVIMDLTRLFFILTYIYIPLFIWAFAPLENPQSPILIDEERTKVKKKAILRVLLWETAGLVGWLVGLDEFAVMITAVLGSVCILLLIEKERRNKNEKSY